MKLLQINKPFKKNGMAYNIIDITPDRSYYLAELYPLDHDKDLQRPLCIEIGRIKKIKAHEGKFGDNIIKYEDKETLIPNCSFGLDPNKIEGCYPIKLKSAVISSFNKIKDNVFSSPLLVNA